MSTANDEGRRERPGDLLAAHHRDLDRRFDELVSKAQECDATELRCEWTAFERELLRHMELEEAEILPGFAQHDAAGARAILADHAEIRNDLLEMGLNLDLHLLRAEAVESFVQRLKAHARREEAALYAWAERHVATGRWSSIKRSLADVVEAPGRAVKHLGHRIM